MKISALPFLAVIAATTFSVANGVIDLDRVLAVQRARILDTSEVCLAAQDAYQNDDAFNATETLYFDNWADALATIDMEDTSVCTTIEKELLIDCVVPDTVAGEDDYRTACTEKGGTFHAGSMDLSCAITLEGDTITVSLNSPPFYVCIPAECDVDSVAAEVDDLQEELVFQFDETFDAIYGLVGGSADCKVGATGASSGATTSFLPSLIMAGLFGIAFVFSS
jgi:hypothetical protein